MSARALWDQRVAAGVYVYQIAREMDMTPDTIHRAEQGIDERPERFWAAYAQALEVLR